jgi:hypothetical protein
MLHRVQALTGRIFQALPNFCPHRQEGTLNTKTTPCSHGFKIYRPGQTDRLTELIYKICKLFEIFEIIGIGFFDCDFLQKFAIGYSFL